MKGERQNCKIFEHIFYCQKSRLIYFTHQIFVKKMSWSTCENLLLKYNWLVKVLSMCSYFLFQILKKEGCNCARDIFFSRQILIFTSIFLCLEEYVFALSHMFFHGKARMKNEILERMNEKRNHCIVSRTFPGSFTTYWAVSQFSGLFHNFAASFPQKEQKHTLQHSWRWPRRPKEPPSGTSCPQAGLFFARASFNYALTTAKKLIPVAQNLKGIYAVFCKVTRVCHFVKIVLLQIFF